MATLIKRYANRKLYNTDTSRYITLKGIATLLDEGAEVRVVDNETGEDITQVALSQILVDNKRTKQDPSDTLLTQILSRGGDALYGAIRKSVDDASDGLGDFQERFRNLVGQAESTARGAREFSWDRKQGRDAEPDGARKTQESSASGFDKDESDHFDERFAELVRAAVVEVIESLDLPRRRDLEELNQNFERVAKAVERLERAYLPAEQATAHVSKRTEKPQ